MQLATKVFLSSILKKFIYQEEFKKIVKNFILNNYKIVPLSQSKVHKAQCISFIAEELRILKSNKLHDHVVQVFSELKCPVGKYIGHHYFYGVQRISGNENLVKTLDKCIGGSE